MAVDQFEAPISPDDLPVFRLARLLLLLEQFISAAPDADIERLGYYDFFAAHPFLIFPARSHEGLNLALLGFDSRALIYQSTPQRFTTRRARLLHDLAHLLGVGFVLADNRDGRIVYGLTQNGGLAAVALTSSYANAYRRSAAQIIRVLRPMSLLKLREQANTWLSARSLLIDLYDA